MRRFKKNYSTLVEKLVQMLPKPPNKYSIITVIKYHEHMVQDHRFSLVSASENSTLNILKATQVSKAAGPDNRSLKDRANFYPNQ